MNHVPTNDEIDSCGVPSNAELDPTLLVVERLIGDHAEAECLCVEIERALLIRDGNADEFDGLDHGCLRAVDDRLVRPQYSQLGLVSQGA